MLDAKDKLIIAMLDDTTDRNPPSIAAKLNISVTELTHAAIWLEKHGYIRGVIVIDIDQMDAASVVLHPATLTERGIRYAKFIS